MLFEISVLAGLLLINAVGVLAVLFQLPGTWLMLLATALAAWLLRADGTFGWWTLGVLLALAILGEVVEAVSGAIGTRRAGGTREAAVLSVPMAIAGATVGASLAGSLALAIIWIVPAWLVIVIAGGVLGAAAGAMLGDRLAGRDWSDAGKAGMGAALGRLGGTVGKLVVAACMWTVVAVAIFV